MTLGAAAGSPSSVLALKTILTAIRRYEDGTMVSETELYAC